MYLCDKSSPLVLVYRLSMLPLLGPYFSWLLWMLKFVSGLIFNRSLLILLIIWHFTTKSFNLIKVYLSLFKLWLVWLLKSSHLICVLVRMRPSLFRKLSLLKKIRCHLIWVDLYSVWLLESLLILIIWVSGGWNPKV